MSKSQYDVENIDGQTSKFTVRPLPLYGPAARAFRTIVLLVAAVIIFVVSSERHLTLGIVVTAIAALLFFLVNKVASKGLNQGRRFTQFTAGPAGITFLSNGRQIANLPLNEIERMYLTAPNAGQVAVHAGFGSLGSYTGVTSTGGASASLVARSWQVVVQVRGVEHWLGGGLTESMASSLATQVQRALPTVWR
ncbi:hypothetical protein ACNHE5_19845 [Pandoraea pnomenusa]|uniref:hypothetical protein n=1 Tax=Pandoraea pnomenusa TaxID=93220 RepID=UPI003CEC5636